MEQTVVGIFCLFRGRGEGDYTRSLYAWSAREGWRGGGGTGVREDYQCDVTVC